MNEGLIGAGFVLFPVGIILLLWVYLGPRSLMKAMEVLGWLLIVLTPFVVPPLVKGLLEAASQDLPSEFRGAAMASLSSMRPMISLMLVVAYEALGVASVVYGKLFLYASSQSGGQTPDKELPEGVKYTDAQVIIASVVIGSLLLVVTQLAFS